MKINTVGIYANVNKSESAIVLRELLAYLGGKGKKVILESETARLVKGKTPRRPLAAIGHRVDLLVTLGGDGTILRVAQELDGKTPILGVNLGGLGFLTSVPADALSTSLDAVLAGKFTLSERATLEGTVVRRGKILWQHFALNDLVLARGEISRIVRIEVRVGRELLSHFLCDGLIFATPTGSTAYSMSAGGPIVSPEAEVVIVSPICPHSLTNRPVILSAQSQLSARLRTDDRRNCSELILTADGQEPFLLLAEDEVRIHTGAHRVRLVTLEGRSYFEVVRQKLQWRGAYV